MSEALSAEQINFDSSLSALSPERIVGVLSALLPSQGPITEFVHHNTLHSFQHLTFHEAVQTASKIYGTYSHVGASERSAGLLSAGLRSSRAQRTGFDVDEFVQPFMIRMTAAFFDQGLAAASLPHRSHGLLGAVRRLSEESFLPLVGVSHRRVRCYLALGPGEVLNEVLPQLVPDRTLWPRYLAEVLLSLKGWAGLCHVVEASPHLVDHGKQIKLTEWTALFVICELNAFLSYFLGENFIVDLTDASFRFTEPTTAASGPRHDELGSREWEAYKPILDQLRAAKPIAVRASVSSQAIFCIDDREFSLRRFLETVAPDVETYGAPGFFGLDIQLAEAGGGRPVKLCPPPMQQQYTLGIEHSQTRGKWLHDVIWSSGARTLLSGWLMTQLAGVPVGLQFIARVLLPGKMAKRRLEETDYSTAVLKVFRGEVPDTPGGRDGTLAGYTFDEAAVRVGGMLDTIGLTDSFAAIVAVIGHGASSTNNPYFAAYDCGACSGRPGSINARIFCRIANQPEVRQRLKQRGIEIPPTTVFVPVLHDTTADHFEVLDRYGCDSGQAAALKRLEEKLCEAAEQNALYRCRQFSGASRFKDGRAAKRHVTERSLSLFEPRPEYNHATNIAAVIGPRWLTAGLSSERALFLNSYDPARDPAGEVVARILGAVIPVCGGINLEYFFSRFDSEVYGAGNKLPQNVVGCIGVMTGIESDLRTGLPLQMTEIHEPRRLLVFVLQRPDLVASAVLASCDLTQWVEHGWINLVVQDPVSGAQFRWKHMQWECVSGVWSGEVRP